MKLVLLQDVKNIGKKGAVVEVADGYARNFLLPRKLAATATEGVIRSIDKEASDLKSKKAREKEAALELAHKLESEAVALTVKVGDSGKIFGSITSADIVDAVQKQFAHSVDKKSIQLKDPIKTLGEHTVPVKLYPEVSAKLRVVVAAAQ